MPAKTENKKNSQFFSSSWSSTHWWKPPDVRLEPFLPITHVYWKMIQLFLNCCISGVFPKPDQLSPTCRTLLQLLCPSQAEKEKAPSLQGAVGTAMVSFLVWDLGFFVTVVCLVLAFFKELQLFLIIGLLAHAASLFLQQLKQHSRELQNRKKHPLLRQLNALQN